MNTYSGLDPKSLPHTDLRPVLACAHTKAPNGITSEVGSQQPGLRSASVPSTGVNSSIWDWCEICVLYLGCEPKVWPVIIPRYPQHASLLLHDHPHISTPRPTLAHQAIGDQSHEVVSRQPLDCPGQRSRGRRRLPGTLPVCVRVCGGKVWDPDAEPSGG